MFALRIVFHEIIIFIIIYFAKLIITDNRLYISTSIRGVLLNPITYTVIMTIRFGHLTNSITYSFPIRLNAHLHVNLCVV